MKSLKPIAFFFLFAITFVLNSCSNEPIDPAIDPTDNNGGSSGMLRWSCKVDGVLHEWSGAFGATTGLSNFAMDDQNATDGNPNGLISLNKNINVDGNEFILSMVIPEVRTGTFILDYSNTNKAAVLTIRNINNPIGIGYASNQGTFITVNINELSNNTAITGDLTARVKGTFSGTMSTLSGNGTITITEGTFEAIRAQ
jgi:hypothetical protein